MPIDDLLQEFTQLTDIVKTYARPINGVVLYFHSIRSFVAYGRGTIMTFDAYTQKTASEEATAENFIKLLRKRYPDVDIEKALRDANNHLHRAIDKNSDIVRA
jgi:hypothetical protein